MDSHDDEGGHTDERHIGKSDQWLRNRNQRETKPKSSTFTNEAIANLTQARFVKKYKKEIKEWLVDSSKIRNFAKDITMDREIGIIVSKKGRTRTTNKAKVVLKKDNSSLGYHILTSYPVP